MSKFVSTITLTVATVFLSTSVQASVITGDVLPANPNWTPNSTNALNYASQTPGRVGQIAPFVLFDSADYGSVTLNFNNGAAGLAFFEIRIDGVDTGSTPHPVVSGDTIHSGGQSIASGLVNQIRNFSATSTVDVRLALGGERDWDFNWVRFSVAPVPEPTTFFVWSVLGVCAAGLRRGRHAE
jgi:hypothetical protein